MEKYMSEGAQITNDAVPSGTLDFQASQRSIQSVDR